MQLLKEHGLIPPFVVLISIFSALAVLLAFVGSLDPGYVDATRCLLPNEFSEANTQVVNSVCDPNWNGKPTGVVSATAFLALCIMLPAWLSFFAFLWWHVAKRRLAQTRLADLERIDAVGSATTGPNDDVLPELGHTTAKVMGILAAATHRPLLNGCFKATRRRLFATAVLLFVVTLGCLAAPAWLITSGDFLPNLLEHPSEQFLCDVRQNRSAVDDGRFNALRALVQGGCNGDCCASRIVKCTYFGDDDNDVDEIIGFTFSCFRPRMGHGEIYVLLMLWGIATLMYLVSFMQQWFCRRSLLISCDDGLPQELDDLIDDVYRHLRATDALANTAFEDPAVLADFILFLERGPLNYAALASFVKTHIQIFLAVALKRQRILQAYVFSTKWIQGRTQ